MAIFQRSHATTLVGRLSEIPTRIVAVFGPRQTGKTTIVRQALRQVERDSRYLSVDEPDTPGLLIPNEAPFQGAVLTEQVRDTEWLVGQWHEARLLAERSDRGFVLAVDEVQKIPNWSETVKGLWDADRARDCPLHVVILGSAPLLMQSGLNESLAGRFEPVDVTHWSLTEMSEAFGFSLEEYLYFGGYPGSSGLIRDQERWRSYVLSGLVEPNIERDILAMTRVDKPALLKRLFEVGSAYSGQILSYNKLLGQLQDAGNTTTLARYLDLLSNAGLLTGLQRYASQQFRRRKSSPKLNVLNTALMTAGSGYSFEEAKADRTFWGRVVESAVGAHLYNTATRDIRLHYWRGRSREVDFVLQRGPRLVTFEVKSGSDEVDLSGMREFGTQFGAHRPVVVGADGVPLNEFLSTPAGEWFQAP